MTCSLFRRVAAGVVIAAVATVRTPSVDASAPAGRFTVAGGSVTDNKTKLIWQQATPQTMYSWSEAKTYCACGGPGLAGVGWRLPTVRELQTLVDPSRMAIRGST